MATKPTAIVAYYHDDVTPFVGSLANVTSVSWSGGRQNITDQWAGTTCLITGFKPSDIALHPQVGKRARVYVYNGGAGTPAKFYGFVSDWRVIYGITAAYDTYELIIESGYARAGRTAGTVATTAGNSTSAMASSLVSLMGSDYVEQFDGWASTTSAQTIVGQYSNAVDQLMVTEQGTVVDTGLTFGGYPQSFYSKLGLYGRNSTALYQNKWTFSDAGTAGTIKYNEVEFLSSAQNYGQVVTVQASGFADQSSGTGDYVQTFSTINGSASEAANLAGYIKAQLNLLTAVPYSITTTGAVSTLSTAIEMADPAYIHQAATIVFRGNTYNCVVEGLSFTANQQDWRVQLFLSSSLQNAFLRLDSAAFGTLDNNRLGF